MWPWLVAGAVGAALSSRQKPKTRCIKREVFGPRTGLIYQTEEFPEAGFLVVHADGARVAFVRNPDGSWSYARHEGNIDSAMNVRRDIESEPRN